MAHELAGISKCKLCGRTFAGESTLIVGENDRRVEQFARKLTAHMYEAHGQVMAAVELRALEFKGMLTLLNYSISDQKLSDQRDRLRWQIHQQTLNAKISDETMQHKSEQLAMRLTDIFLAVCTPEQQAALQSVIKPVRAEVTEVVKQLVTMLRNELQEPDKYPETVIKLAVERPKGR